MDYEGFNERARKRYEMNADAKYLADLQVHLDHVRSEYLQRLQSHPDFADDFKKIVARQIKFDADFEAGEKDPESLADDLLEIEAINAAFWDRIVADGSLLPLLVHRQELEEEKNDAMNWGVEMNGYDRKEFCALIGQHVPSAWEGFGPMPKAEDFDIPGYHTEVFKIQDAARGLAERLITFDTLSRQLAKDEYSFDLRFPDTDHPRQFRERGKALGEMLLAYRRDYEAACLKFEKSPFDFGRWLDTILKDLRTLEQQRRSVRPGRR